LAYDVTALDVGTFLGVSALLLASQPRVLHVTSVDPNPLVAVELAETGKAAGLASGPMSKVAHTQRVQDVALAALQGFPREYETIELINGVIAGFGAHVVPVPDPSAYGARRLVAFVDGLHTRAAVRADVTAIFAAQPDAIVVLDDCRYVWGPFVQAGVADVLEENGAGLAFKLIADVSMSLGTCTLGILYPRALRGELESALDRAAARVSQTHGSLAFADLLLPSAAIARLERERDEAQTNAAKALADLARIQASMTWRIGASLRRLSALRRRAGAD
jgi:hypothetical protein